MSYADEIGANQSFAIANFDHIDTKYVYNDEYLIFYIRASTEKQNPFKILETTKNNFVFKCENLEIGFIHFSSTDTPRISKRIQKIKQNAYTHYDVSLLVQKEYNKIESYGIFQTSITAPMASQLDSKSPFLTFKFSIDMSKYSLNKIEVSFEENFESPTQLWFEHIEAEIEAPKGKISKTHSIGHDFTEANIIRKFLEGLVDEGVPNGFIDKSITLNKNNLNKNKEKQIKQLIWIVSILNILVILLFGIIIYLVLKRNKAFLNKRQVIK